jgi:lycopene cyclase domain-containing protein
MGAANFTYLSSIIVFALIPSVLMVRAHWPIIAKYRKLIVGLTAGLAFYALIFDLSAILLQWGTFSPKYILNIYLGPIPVEEILFLIAVANLIIIAAVIVTTISHRKIKWWEYPLVLIGLKKLDD